MTEDKEHSTSMDESGEPGQDASELKHKLDDQKKRIQALARGREQDIETISKLRDELALIARERDRLRRNLTDLEGMQTETVALGDEQSGSGSGSPSSELPSIDELMLSFSGRNDAYTGSHSTSKVEASDASTSGEYQEMLSPDAMVLGSAREKASPALERFLVLMESGKQTKCPLDQDLLTIGRSESADIQIEGDFISRIHARILRIGMDIVIEDAASKNGTRVNSELIERHVLRHGDLIRIGSAHFRYIDSAGGDDPGK